MSRRRHTPVIKVLRRLRREDHRFESSLGCIERRCFNFMKKKGRSGRWHSVKVPSPPWSLRNIEKHSHLYTLSDYKKYMLNNVLSVS
jgi:hypothetical protein